MNGDKGLGGGLAWPLVAVALVLGPLSLRALAPTRPAAGGSPRGASAARPQAGPPAAASLVPRTREARDAYDLLADALGVDVTAASAVGSLLDRLPGLRPDLDRRGRCLSADAEDAVATVLPLLEAQDAATLASDPRAAAAGRSLASWLTAGAPGSCPAATREALTAVASALDPLSRERIAVGRVRDALRGSTVDALIALVPDPVDSQVRWLYDPMVEAIEGAVAASGYSLDRFLFPDLAELTADGKRGAPLREHAERPGVVLFRHELRSQDATTTQVDRYLVVLLVPEVPTFGMHPRAFAAAASFAASFDPKLRILGPTYSGTSSSLRRALDALPDAIGRNVEGELTARIVSGSATALTNRTILACKGCAVPSSFFATVLPDSMSLGPELESFLRKTSLWRPRYGMLHESNTVYGQQPVRAVGDGGGASSPGRSERSGERFRSLETALDLPFPMHISRLEGLAGEAADGADAEGSASTTRSRVAFDVTGLATDRIPSATPEMTAAEVETALAGLVQTARRSGVSVLGILATDARDKLFIAREVQRRMAGPLMVTLESDLLYVHPQFGAYMRGAIVASSYPLFPDTEQEDGVAYQFTSTGAEGTFNAALALLGYDEAGARREGARPLLDYDEAAPPDRPAGPALWISVVGNDAIWPVRRLSVGRRCAATGSCDYVFPASPPTDAPAASQATEVTVSPSSTAGAAALVLVLVALLAGLGAVAHLRWPASSGPGGLLWRLRPLLAYFDAPDVESRPGLTSGDREQRGFHQSRYVLCCLLPACLTTAFLTALAIAWVRVTHPWREIDGSLSGAFTVVAGIAAVLLPLLFLALTILLCLVIARVVRSASARRLRHVGGTVLIALSVLAFVSLGWYLAGVVLPGRFEAALFYSRAMHLASWVSPLTPLVLVLAPVVSWGALHLVWHRRPGLGEVAAALTPLKSFLVPDDVPAQESPSILPQAHDCGPTSAVPTWGIMAVSVATLALAVIWVVHGVGAFEGRWFVGCLLLAWVIAEAMVALSLVQGLSLWLQTRRMLAEARHHPAAGAYARLPRGRFVEPLSARSPRDAEIREVLRHGRELAALLPAAARGPFSVDFPGLAAALAAPAPDAAEPTGQASPNWVLSRTYGSLERAAEQVVGVLGRRWSGEMQRMDPSGVVRAWLDQAEEFCAAVVLLHVRELLARALGYLTFACAGQAVLLCGHLFFPFQSRSTLLAADWILLIATLLAAWTTFFQMERNEVLSLATARTPGKTNFSWNLARKVLIYGLIPLLTYFALEFPEVAAGLMNWLGPIRGAIP